MNFLKDKKKKVTGKYVKFTDGLLTVQPHLWWQEVLSEEVKELFQLRNKFSKKHIVICSKRKYVMMIYMKKKLKNKMITKKLRCITFLVSIWVHLGFVSV